MSQTAFSHTTSSIRLADQVIRAGAIYSMAEDRKIYRAIAIRDEWIVAASEDPHGLDGLVSADTRVIDDPGLTILPAFDETTITSFWLPRTSASSRPTRRTASPTWSS